jgi:hypothetical protein
MTKMRHWVILAALVTAMLASAYPTVKRNRDALGNSYSTAPAGFLH